MFMNWTKENYLVSTDDALLQPGVIPTQLVQYRRARASDWPKIQELLQNASLPTEDAVDHLDQFTVGVAATDLVVTGGFEHHGANALLRSFAVAPQLRGRQHGKTLLQHVLRNAAAAGVTNVYLLTETAAPFFERLGFRFLERKDAPPAIRNTQEFKQLCPASARLMARPLSNVDSRLVADS
jgi:amino-acid N-acetyltransferase